MGNCIETPRHNLRNASISSVPETPANNGRQHGVSSGNNNSPGNDNVASEYGNRNDNDKNKELTRQTSKIANPNLKKFDLIELKSATRNFSRNAMIGEGGFGRVYKGWIDTNTYAPSKVGIGMAVAVKRSRPDSFQGLEEWQSEVKFLGKFSHPNLVKLLGYCREDGQYLLVYEYMQKGSLENHLFRHGAQPLSWAIRLKIAIEAAQGLSFLHTSEKSVIYRDFKPSNILLDGDYNAKLSDLGLAKLGPINGKSHITTRVMGTHGYAAPEYVDTGHLYVKSDVYGFGVVLLEMLTGLRAVDTKRPTYEQNLVKWAKPSLSSKSKLKKIMDPRLEGQYPTRAAIKAADLIIQCLEVDPRNRPSMEEVLATLSDINTIKDKPDESMSMNQKQQSAHQNYNNHPLRCSSSSNAKYGCGHGNSTRAYPSSPR